MEEPIKIEYPLWIGTALMLTLAFAIIFLALYYQNYVVKLKKKETENLLKATLESEKKERQRIASDLHDTVQGDLNVIRNYLVLLKRSGLSETQKDLFIEINNNIENAIISTHTISNKLMPPLLETFGLVATLRDYFDSLNKIQGNEFTVHSEIEAKKIPKDKKYELFCVIRELTQNMLKHGEANNCKILIYEKKKEVIIEIKDSGKHFNFKEAYEKSKGMGLHNIQSRLTSINALLIQEKTTSGNHFIIHLTLLDNDKNSFS